MLRRHLRLLITALLLCASAGLARADCAASDTALCLNASRFTASVSWKDANGRTGEGHAIAITADTGYFWFFTSSNIELVVKVLDARTVNGKYWVFFGALSNVQYTLTVTDTVTRAQKQYVNPLGQFASVGDTKAFDPNGPAGARVERVEGTFAPPESLAAVQRYVEKAGTAGVAEFTPCGETPFGFNLNGCRFHIEVDWDDGRGRTGIGHPVQLTNDTGYFWFFSPSNVELMVKVLDARGVNGNIWVFFGALSNVKYSMTVTDSLTKTVRRYTNSSGTFASIGDTKAFRGGYSVASVRDEGRAVSARLDATGGTVTATGADGTVFTLEIPTSSLLAPETVTLVPVSRIDRFPFSGGLIAGVEIEPEGVRLLEPATLSIRPAVSRPLTRTLPYAYGLHGEDFILYPRLNEDPAVVQIPLLHFSGYGAGEGDAGDAAQQVERSSTDVLAPYVQRYANELLRRILGLITQDELNASAVEIFGDAFREVVEPLMTSAKESCDRAEIDLACRAAFGILHFIQIYGLADDPALEALTPRAFQLAQDILTSCIQKAFDRCVANTDPFEATLMLYIAQQLQAFGVDDPYLTTFIEGGLLERCLRFEIDFQSKIVDEFNSSGVSTTQRLRFRSQHVPLRLNLANGIAYGAAWDGGCKLVPEVAEIQYTIPRPGSCTVTVNPGESRFEVAAAWIGVLEGDDSTSRVKVIYDPGSPVATATATCNDGSGSHPFPVLAFNLDYMFLHDQELENRYLQYVAENWVQLRVGGGPSQNGEFFAMKPYEVTRAVNSELTMTEETFFFLKHTPDAPMPACD